MGPDTRHTQFKRKGFIVALDFRDCKPYLISSRVKSSWQKSLVEQRCSIKDSWEAEQGHNVQEEGVKEQMQHPRSGFVAHPGIPRVYFILPGGLTTSQAVHEVLPLVPQNVTVLTSTVFKGIIKIRSLVQALLQHDLGSLHE